MRRSYQKLHVGFRTNLHDFARRSISLLTIIALTLAGCSNYKAALQYPSGQIADSVPTGDIGAGNPRFVFPAGFEPQPDTVLRPPMPIKAEKVVTGEPKLAQHSGWVHFRFDVDSTGKISDVGVVRQSNAGLEFAARQILNEWAFEPATVDGTPVAFEDMEVVMGFSDTVTAGEAIGVGAAVIVLLPLALLAIFIGAAAGTTGSFKKN